MQLSSRLLLTAVAATLSLAAQAQSTPATAPAAERTGGHGANIFISGWDTDGDGRVTRAEYEAARQARFALTDENGDGEITAEEYVEEYAVRLDREVAASREGHIRQTNTRFSSLDRDKDGFISRAEWDASSNGMFTRLDTNKDGKVSSADPKPTFERRRPANAEGNAEARPQRDAAQAQRRGPRTRTGFSMPTTHSLEGFLRIYAVDGADEVTREQFDAARAAAFAATDTNGDGKLDKDEYMEEFVTRLDRQIARTRTAQIKQGYTRFEAIDADKNGRISRDEYFTMANRMFERADTNKDDVISSDDPPPAPVERSQADAARGNAAR